MGRHGYSDDLDGNELAMWRGVIASATRGKRGQAFFRALLSALDAILKSRKWLADHAAPRTRAQGQGGGRG